MPGDIVDLATYREAAAHPCHYCGRPCPADDRLPAVDRTAPTRADGSRPPALVHVHAACAMRAELGRGFGLRP